MLRHTVDVKISERKTAAAVRGGKLVNEDVIAHLYAHAQRRAKA